MIKVSDLNMTFGDFHALKDLSINVKTGSIYGLVGTNGAGKTTLIKLLTGVLRPQSGEILFDGEKVFENPDVKRRLAYIPDDLSYFSPFSLEEAGKYYRSVYKVFDEKRFVDMIEQFRLNPKKKMHNFSKGMQKQAAFALAMCIQPSYMVLDEPIDGLDPIIRKVIYKYMIDDMASRQMSVVISSHNLREMEGICDSIGVLDRGELKIERDLDELKQDIHKVQVAFGDNSEAASASRYAGLDVIHRESRGSVDLLIIKGNKDKVRNVIAASNPLIFDMLPLSLEEIFIYELGGDDYDVKDILL